VFPQTDIYALGVVFYELVTGQKPYTADTPAAVAIKQATAPLPRPKDLVPDMHDQVEQLIYKALAKDPKERFANMGAFARALNSLANQPAETSQPWTTLEKPEETATLTMPPGALPTDGAVSAPPLERRRIPRWFYFAGGGLLLSIICILTFTFGYFGLRESLFGYGASPTPVVTSAAMLPTRTHSPSPSHNRTRTPTLKRTATEEPTEFLSKTTTVIIISTWPELSTKSFNTRTPFPTWAKLTPTRPANLYYELTYNTQVWEYQKDGDLDMLVYRDDPTCILEFWWGRGLDFNLKRETTTEFAGITWTITTYLREGKIILEQYTPMVDGREYFNPYGIRIYGYEPISSQCRNVCREVLSTFQLP